MIRRLFVLLLIASALVFAAETEKIHNGRVIVVEDTLIPGESRSIRGESPSVTVYTQDGSANGAAVKQGQAVYAAAGARTVKNTGSAPLHVVRVELLNKASGETWGNTGIPHYKLLLENPYVRVYNIAVKAGTSEPQHTHHDRVVVCLSGADLVHDMPDGRKEPATLKTGEIDWRQGATHVGHNVGKTDLWVIAIEPK
jgi:hypothetical protein